MSELHIDSINKSFGERQLLTDIYLSCKIGEIVGLLGRNGSGKSTLLQIVFGSTTCENRFVKVGKQQTHSIYGSRKMISYLPQANFLPGHVKIKTLIKTMCMKPKIDRVLNHQIVKEHLDKKEYQLSGGERRFIELLMILNSQCSYVLIDEPFNGLSPIYREHMKALIRECSNDKGIIITDHDYENILDISDRLVLLHDGNTKTINDQSELIKWGYLSK